jgi:hypothetical protein
MSAPVNAAAAAYFTIDVMLPPSCLWFCAINEFISQHGTLEPVPAAAYGHDVVWNKE